VPVHAGRRTPEDAGAAAARHKGVTLAKGPVVLFLDDDMQVHSQLVAAHLASTIAIRTPSF